MTTLRFVASALPLVIVALPVSGPASRADRYDSAPSRYVLASVRASTEAEEAALALTAAPTSITDGAAVFVMRDGQFVKVRDGSTGWACMVERDARVNGVAPMCYDPQGARTWMQESMLRTQLEARKLSNTAVQRELDAAYERGTLQHPKTSSMMYMMSSHQVLTTSDGDKLQVIGAWHPHIMIYLPHATADQFALGAQKQAGPVSVPFGDAGGVQIVIEVAHWADSPAMADATSGSSR